MNWKDPVRRTVRTFMQAFVGVFLSQIVLPGNDIPTGDAWEKAAISAAFAGLVSAVTLIQNLLEDASVVPTLLKPADRATGDTVLDRAA